MSTVDVKAERERIVAYLLMSRRMGDNVAIVGGTSLPETTVFECMVQAYPDRRVVHLDATMPVSEAEVLAKISDSLRGNTVLLVTLSEAAGTEVFQYLEQLMRQDHLNAPGRDRMFKPDGWCMVVHSRPGPFPFEDLLPARLALD